MLDKNKKYTMGLDPYDPNSQSKGSFSYQNPRRSVKEYFKIEDLYIGDVFTSLENIETLKCGYKKHLTNENTFVKTKTKFCNLNGDDVVLEKDALFGKLYSIFLNKDGEL